MNAPFTAAYIDLGAGRFRHCIHHPPRGTRRAGQVVFAHAFAEEMNKSRHVVARLARALADDGHEVLLPDLLGCGDSPGDFGDATWSDWVDDLVAAAAWLRARGPGPLWLWGHRAGALLAAEAARRIGDATGLLLWQPAPSGRTVLQQFLRLKVAGGMLAGQAGRITEELKSSIDRGEPVAVAGYTVAAGLARGLSDSTLDAPERPIRIEWLELSSRDEPTLSPAAERALERWRAAGHDARAQVVAGPPFWQTVELETAPALVAASRAALAGAAP